MLSQFSAAFHQFLVCSKFFIIQRAIKHYYEWWEKNIKYSRHILLWFSIQFSMFMSIIDILYKLHISFLCTFSYTNTYYPQFYYKTFERERFGDLVYEVAPTFTYTQFKIKRDEWDWMRRRNVSVREKKRKHKMLKRRLLDYCLFFSPVCWFGYCMKIIF